MQLSLRSRSLLACSAQSREGGGTGWWVPKKLLSAPLQNSEGGSQTPCSPAWKEPELSSPSRTLQMRTGASRAQPVALQCQPPVSLKCPPGEETLLSLTSTKPSCPCHHPGAGWPKTSPGWRKEGVLQHFLCSSIPIDQPVVPFQLWQGSPFRDPYRDRADNQERPTAFAGLGVPPWAMMAAQCPRPDGGPSWAFWHVLI